MLKPTPTAAQPVRAAEDDRFLRRGEVNRKSQPTRKCAVPNARIITSTGLSRKRRGGTSTYFSRTYRTQPKTTAARLTRSAPWKRRQVWLTVAEGEQE